MRKVNLERKIDFALEELTKGLEAKYRFVNPIIQHDMTVYHIERAVSILCMLDDWCVEEKSTYYCLSEIEKNVGNYLEERKRKKNENGY